jgi:hypothetical protein
MLTKRSLHCSYPEIYNSGNVFKLLYFLQINSSDPYPFRIPVDVPNNISTVILEWVAPRYQVFL